MRGGSPKGAGLRGSVLSVLCSFGNNLRPSVGGVALNGACTRGTYGFDVDCGHVHDFLIVLCVPRAAPRRLVVCVLRLPRSRKRRKKLRFSTSAKKKENRCPFARARGNVVLYSIFCVRAAWFFDLLLRLFGLSQSPVHA